MCDLSGTSTERGEAWTTSNRGSRGSHNTSLGYLLDTSSELLCSTAAAASTPGETESRYEGEGMSKMY